MAKVKKKVLASAAKVHGWKSKGKQHALRSASLDRIATDLLKKAEFYRKAQSDPHSINTAVMVTLQDVAYSCKDEAKYLRSIL